MRLGPLASPRRRALERIERHARQITDLEIERDTAHAALDAIEVALFGDNWRRSRDELVERAEALREAGNGHPETSA